MQVRAAVRLAAVAMDISIAKAPAAAMASMPRTIAAAMRGQLEV